MGSWVQLSIATLAASQVLTLFFVVRAIKTQAQKVSGLGRQVALLAVEVASINTRTTAGRWGR